MTAFPKIKNCHPRGLSGKAAKTSTAGIHKDSLLKQTDITDPVRAKSATRIANGMTVLGVLLLLCTPVMAQDIEVESLPAIPILSDKTPSAVAPTQTPPPLNGDDMGMSGTSGGSSVYDLKKNNPSAIPAPQTQTPATTPPQNTITDWNVNQDFATRGDDPKLANKKFCTLKVSFGSMASGPDRKTADKVKSYLDRNGDKLTYTQIPWGKEGEFDYCVDVSDHRNRSEIYKDLKRLLPPKSANAPPTHITGAGFETVTTN